MNWWYVSAILLLTGGILLWVRPEDSSSTDGSNDSDPTGLQHDRLIDRNRFGRFIVAIIFLSAPLLSSMWIGELLLGRTALHMPSLGLLIGFVIGMQFVAWLISEVSVIVPQLQGLVSQNMITGEYTAYGASFHWKYPVEKVGRTSHYTLQDMTDEFSETIPSHQSGLTVKIADRWQPWLQKLAGFANRGSTTIKEEFKDRIKEFFSIVIGILDDDEVRIGMEFINWRASKLFTNPRTPAEFIPTKNSDALNGVIEKINDVIGTSEKVAGLTQTLRNLEERLGIEMLEVFMYDVAFDRKVQDARDARRELEINIDLAIFTRFPGLEKTKAQEAWRNLTTQEQNEMLDRIIVMRQGKGAEIIDGLQGARPFIRIGAPGGSGKKKG